MTVVARTRKNKKHDLPAIKAELLTMAQQGASRPSHAGHPFGKLLTYFCCRSHCYYDAAFAAQIRDARPDWFDPSNWKRKKTLTTK